MNLDDLFPNSLPIKRYRAEEEKPLPRSASIAALSWAAERAGQSYGQFIIGLSTADQQRIQEEFENWKREQNRLKAERMAAKKKSRVATDPPNPGRLHNHRRGCVNYVKLSNHH